MVNLSRIGTTLRQTFSSQVTSFPYLSGDTFRVGSDFAFSDVGDFQRARNWDEIRVVFCKSDALEIFLSEKPTLLNPRVLLSGNSDFDFHSIDETNFGGIRAIFLQNSFISDNKRIFTLPIGLENAEYASNGRISLYSKKITLNKLNSVQVGPFGNTHYERNYLSNLVSDSQISCTKFRVSTRKHIRNIDAHQYVACPRGNGVDTHRVWETLYRGSSPVLLRNSWSESIQNMGFPVNLIEDWKDIRSVTSQKNTLNPLQIRSTSMLWMQYWQEKITNFIE